LIRHARLGDVPKIAELGELFHAEAAWGDICEYVIEDVQKTLAHLVNDENGILFVAEADGEIIGMCGGLAHPIYFNHGHKSGQELFWWVKPGLRGGIGRELLDAMENEARSIGCTSWAMIALDKVQPELTGRLYRRRGYRASEHSWIKRL
jgi:GNAT superfamily N-acetyltransferase